MQTQQNFALTAGDTHTLEVTVAGAAGVLAQPGTGVRWGIAKTAKDQAMRTFVGVITNAQAGRFEVSLAPSDTAALQPGDYYHEAKLIDASGDVATIMSGRLRVNAGLSLGNPTGPGSGVPPFEAMLLGKLDKDGDGSDVTVPAPGSSVARKLREWFGDVAALIGGDRTLQVVEVGGFHPDQEPSTKLHRLRDRVFVGEAAEGNGSFGGSAVRSAVWGNLGPSWLERDGQLVVCSSVGLMALVGASRSSDAPAYHPSPAPIGVSGAVINDRPNGLGWALYADVVQAGSAGVGTTYGLEIAAKNQGGNYTRRPYRTVTVERTGVYGLWLAGGGDPSYGGAPTNPSNAAIVVGKNGTSWNRGIVFDADGISGTDGITGTGVAVEMAKGHQVAWATPGDQLGAAFWSNVSDYAQRVEVRFDNGAAVLAFGGGDAVTVTSQGIGIGKAPTFAFDVTSAQAFAYTESGSSTASPADLVNRTSIGLENSSVGPALVAFTVRSPNTIPQKAFIGAVPNAGGWGPDIVFGRRDGETSYTEDFRIRNDGALLHRANQTVIVDGNSHLAMRSYTVATLPSAAASARLIYVSNESGGATPAFSDGSNWRRTSDLAVVS